MYACLSFQMYVCMYVDMYSMLVCIHTEMILHNHLTESSLQTISAVSHYSIWKNLRGLENWNISMNNYILEAI